METQDNVYAPPRASLTQEAAEPSGLPPFHVVSITKLVLLYVATFGFYSLYWFWKHWSQHKRDKKLDIWPLPRAIFAIFFVNSLNQEIDHRLRRSGKHYNWSPSMWAGAYIFSAVGARLIKRIPDAVLPPLPSLWVGMLLMALNATALVQAQRAANLACGDPDGAGNSRLTAANWAWLVLGGLFWASVFALIVMHLGVWTPTVSLPAS